MQNIEYYQDTTVTFSVRCQRCLRHIHCDAKFADRGVCVCGEQFVLVPSAQQDWCQPQGARCMDCGTPFGMTEPKEGRNPWNNRTPHQWHCAQCREPKVQH